MHSGDASTSDDLRARRQPSRRRLRSRVNAVRAAPLSDVLREHALVHLPPAAAARLRLVHPSWERRLASPLFAVAHAAAPRRMSGIFVPSVGFLPFDGSDDAVPSPTLAFAPASEEVTVLSSSHGVACCYSPADDAFFVCNPATASWAPVPPPPCRTWPRPTIVVLFDATPYNFRGDYALVCAAECAPGSGAYCFLVFTSGTGAWRATDAVVPAEGLVAASGVAAGQTAWWRTSVGTAVGYSLLTGRVEMVLCPGDSGMWEIGSAAGKLHCAVRDGNSVAVFRLHEDGSWEEAGLRVSVAELLPRRRLKLPGHENDDASGHELVAQSSFIVERAVVRLDDGVRLLGFQGAELEVVALAGRRLVAFDVGTRRRREVRVPVAEEEEEEEEEEEKPWDGAEYTAHTNTLALVAPAVLAGEPIIVEEERPDAGEVAFS
ncbi:uncharacterized protein LOC123398552 [Hordeum vulgare subsp. vulgare]|uniref:F-box domain-containing protein n=1 Tax=Hordeum vulgare subsp. vulgare TaxID=112509 RepID=A0A8I7B9Y0_HORVV|nr:uncharacterized protein LOC123398552 [Hordeum vulgare subsp. vulgare]